MITKNIFELEAKAHEVFAELGYSERTIREKLFIVKKLIRLHKEHGKEQLDKNIIDNYVLQKEICYRNGEIVRGTLNYCKALTDQLIQIYDTGTVVYKSRRYSPKLNESFEGILSDILANEVKSYKTRQKLCSNTRVFFRWLSNCGHIDMSSVDEQTVREYLADCSARMVGSSLDKVRRAIKELFIFVSENGVLPVSLHKLFLFKIPINKKIKPFMPANEIAAILNVIDQTTIKGKRDYAVILLAATTGLRGCDIAELRLDSIDWRNGEIRIIQEKTEKALALPLTSDVAEAIREYILNARPTVKSDKVFLGVKAPFNGISRSVLNYALNNYRTKAGLTIQRGFHSLRRWFATNMVTSGVSVITVSQALGQAKVDSVKPYISLDSLNLKECALDFSGIQIGGVVK